MYMYVGRHVLVLLHQQSEAEPRSDKYEIAYHGGGSDGKMQWSRREHARASVVYPEQWNLALISDCYGVPTRALRGV